MVKHISRFILKNLSFFGSDHAPILLNTSVSDNHFRFKFEAKWLFEKDFFYSVKNIWSTLRNLMYQLIKKIKIPKFKNEKL